MTSKDYKQLDVNILKAIGTGRVTFTAILGFTQSSKSPADQLASGNYRAVDRRLQVLRKKGLIKFSRKTGWEISYDSRKD